jgi:hypothetical protein
MVGIMVLPAQEARFVIAPFKLIVFLSGSHGFEE